MPDISPDYLTLFPAGNINIGLARMPQLSRLRFVQLGECLRLGPTLTHLELASDRISVGSQSRDKAEASLDISIQVFGAFNGLYGKGPGYAGAIAPVHDGFVGLCFVPAPANMTVSRRCIVVDGPDKAYTHRGDGRSSDGSREAHKTLGNDRTQSRSH
ncbi:hypothetical protein B0H17DRAFT_1154826 [Mycena rosella]|uniref:Uncharacterized protein n=1 Tax=Mycena rosella TaxID=1033263 RepID=A0AAD7AXC3_MYCRO|nr:hypothetical protein B0H17DRAFT_1154826 [Mycena rosella]